MDGAFNPNELSKPSTNSKDQEKMTIAHRLLLLLVEYTCEERLGQCDNDKLTKLQKWLELLHADDRSPVKFYNVNGSCCVKWPDSLNSDANIPQEIPNSEDKIILGQVSFYSGNITNWLVRSKWDIHSKHYRGETILHRFIYNIYMNQSYRPCMVTEDKRCRVRKFMKGLLELNAPLFAMTSGGSTPLDAAAGHEDIVMVQTIVDHLTETSGCDGNGQTALHIVVNRCVNWNNNYKDGFVDLVRTLVEKGASVNARNSHGWTPVHLAADKFQPDMLKLFANKGGDFDERTNDGQTSLHVACKSTVIPKFSTGDAPKSIETFDFLVAQGCDLEAEDNEGYKPLHFAAEFRCVEIVDRLIALGASVDCRTKETLLTPLYLAAKGDKLDNIKALVRAGADVNAEAADGSTPIFMSALVGSHESMQFLIDQGADLHRRDSLMGFTLLHVAANGVDLRPEFKAPPNTQTEDRLKKLKVLIDKGLDVNGVGICGTNPLQLAALAPNVDAVKLLLDRGANVDLQSSEWTALHSASLMKAPDIVEILLANGADVTRRGGIGRWTPVHLSVMCGRRLAVGHYSDDVDENDARLLCPMKKLWSCGDMPSIESHRSCGALTTMLIDHGADVNAECARGRTPLHAALRTFFPHHQTRNLLDSGARVYVQDKDGKLPLHYACDQWNAVDMVKMLLDFGADINDDDSIEMIMNRKCKSNDATMDGVESRTKNVAIQHAIKLQLLGLPVAKIYEPFFDAPQFADFYERCSKEATTLVNHRDADGFSLYNFLKMDSRIQYHWVKRISDSYGNLEDIFPIYGAVIRSACRESVNRKPLLEAARVAWNQITKIRLPEVCVEHILSYLSNRYLKIFTNNLEEAVQFNV